MKWVFNEKKKIERIAIIGGGISGLQSANILKSLNQNLKIKLFEKNSSISGVWASNYIGLNTQTPIEYMKIPGYDLKFKTRNEDVFSQEEFKIYIENYSKENSLNSMVCLNHEVLNIDYIQSQVEVKYCINDDYITNKIYSENFDFVIICQGLFNIPSIPNVKGIENFQGKVYHSSELNSNKLIENKNVVIVGSGKSACDVAGEISKYSKSTTLLMKKVIWSFPLYLYNCKSLIFVNFLMNSTFNKLMVDSPIYYSKFISIWHIYFKGIKRSLWKIFEYLIDKQYNLSKNKLKSVNSIEKDILSNGIYISSENFYNQINKNKITCLIDQILEFKNNELLLNSGKVIPIDVVCFATGFNPNLNIIGKNIIKAYGMEFPNNPIKLELYKKIINLSIPNSVYWQYNYYNLSIHIWPADTLVKKIYF